MFQVAWNPLKFGMPITLFVLKMSMFFFWQAGKQGFKRILEQWFSSQWSKSYIVWRQTQRERRGDFQFGLYFSAFLKKTKGHFTQKESACQISVDSKQLEKSLGYRYICLPSTEPFIYNTDFSSILEVCKIHWNFACWLNVEKCPCREKSIDTHASMPPSPYS